MSERKYALDMKSFRKDTFAITFEGEDGEEQVLHVKKPNEEIMMKFIDFTDGAENDTNTKDSAIAVIQKAKEYVPIFISNNSEGIIVDDAFIEKYDIEFDQLMAIFRVYSEFVSDIMSDPNSNAPSNQGQTEKEAQTTK